MLSNNLRRKFRFEFVDGFKGTQQNALQHIHRRF